MIRAATGGVALAMAGGPVGCFILWKRMAYFGDMLAHSALLGIALATLTGLNSSFAVFVLAVLISFVLNQLRQLQIFSADALLAIFSHAGLAAGLILVAVLLPGNTQLNTILFGDILALTWSDVWISLSVSALILLILASQWSALIARTISEPIAKTEQIGSNATELIFMVLCSGLVAIAMKITGVLLISALLILPAAIARIFTNSPEKMAFFAAMTGAASIICGLGLSFFFDLPSGPAIILTAATGFIFTLIISGFRNKYFTGHSK